ncbi:MAG TPA: flagellar motor protein MotB [Terriglobales bacterium]|nr:flagellar motor protein MotB [Terriglobales bacterium]
MAANAQPIVIKRKGAHGGHHGGAWKVAYADFVTAMMALFIVLWLMNTSKPVQEAISGYFKDPAGTGKLTGVKAPPPKAVTKENLDKVKAELEKAIRQVANFDKLKDHIQMTVTQEGLRIELLESQNGTFFESGKPDPNANGRELLMTIAEELGKAPNKVSIEGHTDSQPFSAGANYTNWELSVDRANTSRRIMQQHGLRSDQVAQVRGFADQQPREGKDPADPSNRRITMIVQYQQAKSEGPATDGAKESLPPPNPEGTTH